MKKIAMMLLLAASLQLPTMAQNEKTFDVKDFDKVKLSGVNTNVTIKLGSTFSVTASGTDEIIGKLEVTVANNTLTVKQGEVDYKIWKQGKQTSITITMPEISVFTTSSNGNANISGFVGRYLRIAASGNGNVTLKGTQVDELDIDASGNGNVHTNNVNADKVKIKKSGNGDVTISTKNTFDINFAGNGDVVNYGEGKANFEEKIGNGEVRYKN